MSANIVALLYLVSGVLFILALKGLSSPESSRRGNLYGMVGMAIAILTTLAIIAPDSASGWALEPDHFWVTSLFPKRWPKNDQALVPLRV